MRQSAIILLATLGATALSGVAPSQAQYYPYPPPAPPGYGPPPPDYPYGPPSGYHPPPRDYDRPVYGRPDYARRCPPGYTVQGGACQPYRGPGAGGWRTWNGCPPGYTVQGGQCSPYRGR